MDDDRTLISRRDLAARWGISPKTLANWSCLKVGPKVVRPSGQPRGKAFYAMSEIRMMERSSGKKKLDVA